MEKENYWIDGDRNYHCESCGRIVEKEDLFFEKYLGYYKKCYIEIQEYENILASKGRTEEI